jgi:Zn-dependent protease with chaperone function
VIFRGHPYARALTLLPIVSFRSHNPAAVALKRSGVRNLARTYVHEDCVRVEGIFMVRAVWLLVMVLAVPLAAIGITSVVQSRLDLNYRGSFSTSGPGLAQACAGSAMSGPADCAEYRAAGVMLWAAGISAAVGVGLLGAITALGYLARFNRIVLLLAFTVGLPLTNLLVVVMLLIQGVMVVVCLHLAMTVLVGRSLPILIVTVGAGALFGAFALVRASLTTVKVNEIDALGVGLEKDRHPALWTIINGLAAKLGVTPPKYVIVGLDPTFYVTEVPVRCLNGRSSGRILYLSLPLCRILTQEELVAVIGHELGHFRGNDLWFSRRFYPIYQGTLRSLGALHGAADDLIQMIPLYPAVTLLTLFFESFTHAESKTSRDRELAADQCGVAASGAMNVAVSLAKLTAYEKEWERGQMLRERQARLSRITVVNVSAEFAESVQAVAVSAAVDRLADERVSHPMDTHPPLKDRLAALSVATADLGERIADTRPEAAAIHLISEYEALEDELSEGLFERLKRS